MGPVYALDFGAILLLAQAMGVLTLLIIDVLPEIKPIFVKASRETSDNPEPNRLIKVGTGCHGQLAPTPELGLAVRHLRPSNGVLCTRQPHKLPAAYRRESSTQIRYRARGRVSHSNTVAECYAPLSDIAYRRKQ